MATVSIRELKAHLSEIIRRVDERRETVEVTRGGKVIVRIEPVANVPSEEEIERFWAQHMRLAEELGERWAGEPDSTAVIRGQRRNLTPDEWVPPDWRPSE
jgi:prevent-host-death family protein